MSTSWFSLSFAILSIRRWRNCLPLPVYCIRIQEYNLLHCHNHFFNGNAELLRNFTDSRGKFITKSALTIFSISSSSSSLASSTALYCSLWYRGKAALPEEPKPNYDGTPRYSIPLVLHRPRKHFRHSYHRNQ